MATKNHNLSQFDSPLPSAADMRFGIVVAEWNREVTEALLEGAVRTLRSAGCPDINIQSSMSPARSSSRSAPSSSPSIPTWMPSSHWAASCRATRATSTSSARA